MILLAKIKELNILISGVGGQGNILASAIIAEAAIKQGHKVRTTETFGAAQRGGTVVSHVRIGSEIHSPLIPEHRGNVIVGLEPIETLRSAIRYSAADCFVIMNTRTMVPISVKIGEARYPSIKKISGLLRQLVKDLITFDATTLAEKAGNSRMMNIVMVGALSATEALPIPVETIKNEIEERAPRGTKEANLRAFNLGFARVQKEKG